MLQFVHKIIGIYQLLNEVGLMISFPTKLWCDNQATLYITSNLEFHVRIKHIDNDNHFFYEKIQEKIISIVHIKKEKQLKYIFIRVLNGARVMLPNYLHCTFRPFKIARVYISCYFIIFHYFLLHFSFLPPLFPL